MKIIKASGQQEDFNHKKFCKSLSRAGIPEKVVNQIYLKIQKRIKPGTTTQELFNLAREYLLDINMVYASKYSLKNAIMELGPTGFTFEGYFAAILKEYGHKTSTNQVMVGECVDYEIDIMSEYKDNHYIIEAKYHNKKGIKSDVADIIYTYAKTLDIESKHKQTERGGFIHRGWLVTNTKLTSKAIKYGRCKNMKMTAWRYPGDEGLEKIIENKMLYPVTLLPAINRDLKEKFAKHNIYFAKSLTTFTQEDLKIKFGIKPDIAQQIYNQAQGLTSINNSKNTQ